MNKDKESIRLIIRKRIVESICNSQTRFNVRNNIDELYVPIVVFLENEYPIFVKATIVQSQFNNELRQIGYDEIYGVLLRLCGYGLLERKVIENTLFVRIREDIKKICQNEMKNNYLEQKKQNDSIKKKPQEI